MTLESKTHIYIDCQIQRITDRAVQIHDGARNVWLPVSQIEDPETFEAGEHTKVLIPLWLAEEKGLV